MEKHKCPVCGQYEFPDEDSFDVCEVCGWEDDGLQEDDPDYAGGANHYSLNQFRKEWFEEMNSKQGGK
ncbi:MAG: hypothetical protein LUE97_08635 [Oscillospiraceae bacterium]|nr:hypothetical protein [Oscillospiraceae bacterium]